MTRASGTSVALSTRGELRAGGGTGGNEGRCEVFSHVEEDSFVLALKADLEAVDVAIRACNQRIPQMHLLDQVKNRIIAAGAGFAAERYSRVQPNIEFHTPPATGSDAV